MSSLVGALWRNWKGHQKVRILNHIAHHHVYNWEQVRYAILNAREGQDEVDIMLQTQVHTLVYRIGRRVRFSVDIPTVEAHRYFLNKHMRMQCETRRFYDFKRGDLHCLFKQWIPRLDVSNSTENSVDGAKLVPIRDADEKRKHPL